jgi:hypothetical protein
VRRLLRRLKTMAEEKTMHRTYVSLILVGLLAIGLSFAPHLSAMDRAVPYTKVDTQGNNAVVLDLSVEGKTFSRILVLENEMGTVDFGNGKGSLGLGADWISDRGDAVRVGVYTLDKDYDREHPTADRWIEDLDLTRDAAVASPEESAVRAGEPTFRVRLVDVILVDR